MSALNLAKVLANKANYLKFEVESEGAFFAIIGTTRSHGREVIISLVSPTDDQKKKLEGMRDMLTKAIAAK